MNRITVAIVCVFCLGGLADAGPIADRMMVPIQEQENAQRRLDLQQRQRTYGERIGDLSPGERMDLQRRQRQQQVEQRYLQQRQRQRADTALRTQQALPDQPSQGRAAIRAQRDRTEQQAQQLHFQIQQSTWPYGRPSPRPTTRPPPRGALDTWNR